MRVYIRARTNELHYGYTYVEIGDELRVVIEVEVYKRGAILCDVQRFY